MSESSLVAKYQDEVVSWKRYGEEREREVVELESRIAYLTDVATAAEALVDRSESNANGDEVIARGDGLRLAEALQRLHESREA